MWISSGKKEKRRKPRMISVTEVLLTGVIAVLGLVFAFAFADAIYEYKQDLKPSNREDTYYDDLGDEDYSSVVSMYQRDGIDNREGHEFQKFGPLVHFEENQLLYRACEEAGKGDSDRAVYFKREADKAEAEANENPEWDGVTARMQRVLNSQIEGNKKEHYSETLFR